MSNLKKIFSDIDFKYLIRNYFATLGLGYLVTDLKGEVEDLYNFSDFESDSDELG